MRTQVYINAIQSSDGEVVGYEVVIYKQDEKELKEENRVMSFCVDDISVAVDNQDSVYLKEMIKRFEY